MDYRHGAHYGMVRNMKTIFVPMQFRCARINLGKTLNNVSAETEISLSFLSDIEQGRTLPSLKTLLTLIDYYNMDVSHPFSQLPEVE